MEPPIHPGGPLGYMGINLNKKDENEKQAKIIFQSLNNLMEKIEVRETQQKEKQEPEKQKEILKDKQKEIIKDQQKEENQTDTSSKSVIHQTVTEEEDYKEKGKIDNFELIM